jgi:hypothetical protein
MHLHPMVTDPHYSQKSAASMTLQAECSTVAEASCMACMRHAEACRDTPPLHARLRTHARLA